MGRMKNYYWLDSQGQQIAQHYRTEISHALADFVGKVTSQKNFPLAEAAKENVLQVMVEAWESLREYYSEDDW